MEDFVNPFTKSILSFFLSFPSAKSIVKTKEEDVINFFNLAFEGRGKKSSFSPNQIIDLAKNSIGIDSPSYEFFLKSKIEQLLSLGDELYKFDKLLLSTIENARGLSIGIYPVIKESRKYKGEFSIPKRGNRHLRRTIFLMTLNVIRFNTKFKLFFERLRKRGKSFKSAIIAVANKLVRIIYSILIHIKFYSPNY